MEAREASASMEALISSFNARISELKQLVIARNMSPASSATDLGAIDASLTGMEFQVENIKNRLREEAQVIPKAKKLIVAALRQKKTLESISALAGPSLPDRSTNVNQEANKWVQAEVCNQERALDSLKLEEPALKEKKGRPSAPMWCVTEEELNSVPSYMKQRLTLEKVNAAISDMATYAETNKQLIKAPRKKLTEKNVDRAMELRDIAAKDEVKGKYFFLEADIKGPALKLDHTGKAILTILRHLGRLTETRIGHHRVIILLRP